MNSLLIDIGNSRIKWFFDNHQTPLMHDTTPPALSYHHEHWIDMLRDTWQAHSTPTECHISNVSGHATLDLVQQLLAELYPHATVVVITPRTQQNGLTLAYDAHQIGTDRYVQLLGAQNIYPQTDHLVISAGTATTVDGVRSGGQHLGGIILPSMDLMRKSLHQYTAKLPLEDGHFCAIQAPHNTLDALATATMLATIGAIHEFMWRYMKKECAVLLCGGYAPLLAPELKAAHVDTIPSLCLLGLKLLRP